MPLIPVTQQASGTIMTLCYSISSKLEPSTSYVMAMMAVIQILTNFQHSLTAGKIVKFPIKFA